MSGLPWGRLYYEWAHDLKIQTLPEAFQRRHAMLLCMHIEGLLRPTDEDAAFYMRLSLDQWLKTKAALIDRGLLDESNHLINWERRQFKSDASAARVRKHREALSGRYGNVTVTPPDTDTDTEADAETESESEAPHSPPAGGGAVAGEDETPEAVVSKADSQEPKKRRRSPESDPVCAEVAEAYHRLLPHLPPHRLWSSRDLRFFRRNRDLDPARGRAEFWAENIFPLVARSPFLSGRCPPQRGAPWRASLPWLLNPDNVAKILNGHYASDGPDNRRGHYSSDDTGSAVPKTSGGRSAKNSARLPAPQEFDYGIRPLGHKGPLKKG